MLRVGAREHLEPNANLERPYRTRRAVGVAKQDRVTARHNGRSRFHSSRPETAIRSRRFSIQQSSAEGLVRTSDHVNRCPTWAWGLMPDAFARGVLVFRLRKEKLITGWLGFYPGSCAPPRLTRLRRESRALRAASP